MNELEHELILGMDFCSLFDVDVRLGRGLWRVHPGDWHRFDSEEGSEFKPSLYVECAGISIIEPNEQEHILELVDRVLADESTEPGPTRLIEHRIQLTADESVCHKPRRMSPGVFVAALRIVDQWELQVII